jgi:hypothetical protein
MKKKDLGLLDPLASVLGDSGSESELEIIPDLPKFAVPRAVGGKDRTAASASGVSYSSRPDASSFKASSSSKPIASTSGVTQSPLDAVFGYEYVDPDGNLCKKKEMAFVDFDVEGALHKITYHQSQFRHAKAARVLKTGLPGSDGRITGYLCG